MTKKVNHKIKELADKADLIIHGFAFTKVKKEIFEDVLEKNISANPDLPAEFVKDILIAKELPTEPFDMELELTEV